MTVINHLVVGVSFFNDGRAGLVLESMEYETEVCGGIVFAALRDKGVCLPIRQP